MQSLFLSDGQQDGRKDAGAKREEPDDPRPGESGRAGEGSMLLIPQGLVLNLSSVKTIQFLLVFQSVNLCLVFIV